MQTYEKNLLQEDFSFALVYPHKFALEPFGQGILQFCHDIDPLFFCSPKSFWHRIQVLVPMNQVSSRGLNNNVKNIPRHITLTLERRSSAHKIEQHSSRTFSFALIISLHLSHKCDQGTLRFGHNVDPFFFVIFLALSFWHGS